LEFEIFAEPKKDVIARLEEPWQSHPKKEVKLEIISFRPRRSRVEESTHAIFAKQ
jgi:hypothetical protein